MPLRERAPGGTHITVTHGSGHPGGPPYDDSSEFYDDTYESEDLADSEDYGEDVTPSDSASASYVKGPAYYGRGQPPGPRRSHQRVVPFIDPQQHHQSPGPGHPPFAPPGPPAHPDHGRGMTMGDRNSWGYGRGGGGAPWAREQQYYQDPHGGRGDPYGHGPPGPVAPYNAPIGGAMAHYGGGFPQHPFASQGGRGGFYGGGYDMGLYGGHGFYNPQHQQWAVPPSMQQYQQMAPVPPATEHPGKAPTPGPPPKDEEKERMQRELEERKKKEDAEKEARDRAAREAELIANARRELAEEQRRIREAEAEKAAEVAAAKAEAERLARERIEAERKAEKQRQKEHEEAMKRAEENARLKYEAEQKAAEAKRKQEEEDRKRAEEAARIRIEAALKAEAEAKKAAEEAAAAEVARTKQIEEDAKRKAEADAAAKVEKEKADAIAKAEAEAAAKKEQEELKKKWQEEAREAAKKQSDKAPIKFKDAVGRKFNFPFEVCKKWSGMEDLIKQAFLQVDVLGPHVQEGHYDLIGPSGEIILPSVWESVLQPDWSITMTMWPLDKNPTRRGPPGGLPPRPGGPMGAQGPRNGPMPPPDPRDPRHVPGAGGIHPPPGWIPRDPRDPRNRRPPPGIDIMNAAPKPKHKHKKDDPILKFFSGSSKPKKKKK